MLFEAILAAVCAALSFILIRDMRRTLIQRMEKWAAIEKAFREGIYDRSDLALKSRLRQIYFLDIYKSKGLAAELALQEPTSEELKEIFDRIRDNPVRQREELFSMGGSEIASVNLSALPIVLLMICFFYGIARIIEYSLLPPSDYVYVVSDGFLAFFALCFAGPFTIFLLEPFVGTPLYRSKLGAFWKKYYSAANPLNPLIVSVLLVFLALIGIVGLYAMAISVNSYTAFTESGLYDSQKLVPWDQVKDIYRVTNSYESNQGPSTSIWYEIDLADGTQIVISKNLKEVKYSADRGAAYVSQKTGQQILCGIYDRKTSGRKECGPEVETILVS